MPDALPLTGLFGKVPAHGDFVRRGLPTSFVGPWDSWLQDGMATARERLGDRWAERWDGAPPWRFALPAGACGPDAVAGVMLPSEDMVGRRFPITLAALLAPGDAVPGPAWFAALEAAALAGRGGQADADALAAAIPMPDAAFPEIPGFATPATWPLAEPADPPPLSSASTEAEPIAGDLLDMFGDAMPAVPDALPPSTGDGPVDGSPAPPDGLDVLGLFSDAPIAAPAPTWPTAEPPRAEPRDDVLDMLGSPAVLPAAPQQAISEPAPSDGTLAFLLGEAAGTASDPVPALLPAAGAALDAAPQPSAGPDDAADPLAALIAAGDGPFGAAPPLPAPAREPVQAAALPEPFDPAPSHATHLPADAPDPPPGGGWWSGGGGRLPPMIRPRPALLPAADFASLLEADA
ncbi:type VI secretion system-associated protein TagF [Roseomonas sp. CAU 1739]|uniref:type VI secretion system-associated protein TagF n=1 Tax=Roseomonas sp. CAU 1739 TaxID=3140364 RepID=UPI00325BF92A